MTGEERAARRTVMTLVTAAATVLGASGDSTAVEAAARHTIRDALDDPATAETLVWALARDCAWLWRQSAQVAGLDLDALMARVALAVEEQCG